MSLLPHLPRYSLPATLPLATSQNKHHVNHSNFQIIVKTIVLKAEYRNKQKNCNYTRLYNISLWRKIGICNISMLRIESSENESDFKVKKPPC